MGKDKEYFEKIAEYGQLIVISGPSGVGKRTIIKEYMKQPESAVKCVSVTTRAQKPEEVDGREHYFVSQFEFERMVRSQQLLEYEYYNRNGYGTPRKAVEEQRKQGKNVIVIADVTGAMRIRARCPEATLIFILSPTWEALETRIRERHAGNDEKIEELLSIAQEEILCAEQYDYILINDSVEKTVRRLGQIIHGNRYSKNSMKTFMQSYIKSEIQSDLVDEILSL